jgi:uncharacterized DUF497 family protein
MVVIYTEMIDLGRVVGFQWDSGNDRKSEDKHGVARTEAEQIFFNSPLRLAADEQHSQREERFHALGRTDGGRILHVTFTLRAERRLIRIISARDANRTERGRYG